MSAHKKTRKILMQLTKSEIWDRLGGVKWNGWNIYHQSKDSNDLNKASEGSHLGRHTNWKGLVPCWSFQPPKPRITTTNNFHIKREKYCSPINKLYLNKLISYNELA